MRRVVTGVIVSALGVTAAGEVAAQPGVVVPITITRPPATRATSGGTSETRVLIPGSLGTAGGPATFGTGRGFSTSPTTSGEIRIQRGDAGARGGGGVPAGSSTPRSFHTAPTQRHEIRVFGNGSGTGGGTRAPLFILAD